MKRVLLVVFFVVSLFVTALFVGPVHSAQAAGCAGVRVGFANGTSSCFVSVHLEALDLADVTSISNAPGSGLTADIAETSPAISDDVIGPGQSDSFATPENGDLEIV